jgi:tetratricopeptide (TPR) repeat protein
MDRYPDFAPARALKAEQIETRGAVPAEEGRARALSHLREALSLDDSSIRYRLQLGRKLYRRNSDSKEARQLLERARDGAVAEGRVRNREALEAWASYLQRRGWDQRAERAWERALEVDPTNCRAARSLQTLWSRRDHHPPLEEITPEWERCPALERKRTFARSDRSEERLEFYRREARRNPYRASAQIDYADGLRAQGRENERLEVLEGARERMPWSNAIRIELAEHRLAAEGRSAAVETLREAIDANGSSPTLERRLAELRNEEPLANLMRDGRQAAMDHLEALASADEKHPAARSSDEAYYLIDYAARKYADNGSSTTLTHTVVRVMTKGAIDRFGEKSIPGDARLLRARTINEDGTVEIPDRSARKSTLSMPGLDPGDFVEFAFVQYRGPSSKAESHIEGLQFYFRMSDISSLHSEYALLGVEDPTFIRRNDPPEAARYSEAGHEGIHFVREESPRPREESYAPNGTEYLPWIQLYRKGFEMAPFDVDRRHVADRVRNSLEISRQLEAKLDEWRNGSEPGSAEEIRELFYRVTDHVATQNSTNFSRDASHVLAAKRGSAHVLLQAAYEAAGIDSELYVVKTQYKHPGEFPVGEFGKYESPLLRVELPDGETVWLNPSGPDAMFNVINLSTAGQPAVCVSCEELIERRVPEEGFRPTDRAVDIRGTLGASGGLSGSAELTFHGIRAVSVRSTLRETPEDWKRRKFFDRVVSNLIPGSNIVDFEVRKEDAADKPLEVRIDFEHPNFGRSSGGRTMRVETPLFREPIASRYAKLGERERPLLIPRQRETNYTLEIDLPDGRTSTLESRSGSWELDSEWGSFRRTVEVDNGTLSVDSALRLPIQRVSTEQYRAFKEWAYGVQNSSRLNLVLAE